MPRRPSAVDDRRLERVLGDLLRAGVLISAAVVLAGGVLTLVRHGTAAPDYRIFRGEPADLRHLGGILRGARALEGRGLIQLGLLLLVATPVARVLFALVGFALERDRIYVAVALIVLGALIYGLAFGPA